MEKKKWDGQTQANSLGIKIFIITISFFGLLPAYFLLFFVSWYYTLFVTAHNKFIKSFRSKLGLSTNLINIYKHNFIFGLNIVDRFAHLVMKKSPFKFECIGEEHLVNALSKNTGLIVLSSHIGNQEIAGDMLFSHIKTGINFLKLDNEKQSVKKVINTIAEERPVKIIPTNSSSIDMMIQVRSALVNNEIVCMLGDRVMGEEPFMKINFLGKEAKFPTSPFNIAAITGTPVICAVTIKTGIKKYRQEVFDYISFENTTRSNRENKIKESMVKYVNILEQIVRQNPYHWFNFYDYWEEY